MTDNGHHNRPNKIDQGTAGSVRPGAGRGVVTATRLPRGGAFAARIRSRLINLINGQGSRDRGREGGQGIARAFERTRSDDVSRRGRALVQTRACTGAHPRRNGEHGAEESRAARSRAILRLGGKGARIDAEVNECSEAWASSSSQPSGELAS